MHALFVTPAQLRGDRIATQQRVNGVRDIGVHGHALAVLDFDDHVERGRGLALQDALLGSSPARLIVAQSHALDPADQVGQSRVQHEVVQVVAVGGSNELDAALGDGPGGGSLKLRPDLVDDDDLRHVVLDRLDHHLVLEGRRPDLHSPRLADRRVRDVAVAGNLVGRIHDHDAFAHVVGEDACGLAQHRGLADPRAAQDQDRLSALDEVVDDLDRAVDRPADPAGEPDDLAGPIADRADPVERALDAGPVVVAKAADMLDHKVKIRLDDLAVQEPHLRVRKARLRPTAEVHHHLDQRHAIRQRVDRIDDFGGQGGQERVEIIDRFAVTLCAALAVLAAHLVLRSPVD